MINTPTAKTENFSSIAAFIWSVADTLRGDFKQSEYGRVILPFTIFRRLECVLELTCEAVVSEYTKRKGDDRKFIGNSSNYDFRYGQRRFTKTTQKYLRFITGICLYQ
ncbi:MAG: type I restriction-modification system subunit M N-terminal domain-containing protein [Leptospirales bacterium]